MNPPLAQWHRQAVDLLIELLTNLLTAGGLATCIGLSFSSVASAQAQGSLPDKTAIAPITAADIPADIPNEIPHVISEEIFEEIPEETFEEIPEEILRTEIITGANSPLTGEPISAAEYAQLQAELAAASGDPLVNQQLRYLIFLLQIRRGLQPIIPFL